MAWPGTKTHKFADGLLAEKEKLVIVGGSDMEFPEIAFEYFTYDSQFEVVGFSVERRELRRSLRFKTSPKLRRSSSSVSGVGGFLQSV